ncbi:methylmalonic aciduria and homocystinuria type D, mitochondrial isoform X1, partial [Pelobates cultripes]
MFFNLASRNQEVYRDIYIPPTCPAPHTLSHLPAPSLTLSPTYLPRPSHSLPPTCPVPHTLSHLPAPSLTLSPPYLPPFASSHSSFAIHSYGTNCATRTTIFREQFGETFHKALCSRARLVTYLPGFCSLIRRVQIGRPFSAAGSSGSDEPFVAATPPDILPRTVWPDEAMGPFGPQDQRFQLPGNVGFDAHVNGVDAQRRVPGHRNLPDLLSEPAPSERHEFVMAQFVNEFQGNEASPQQQQINSMDSYFEQAKVECAMQSCPELLKKDFASMFPEIPSNNLMVMTVTQKTANDMTTWSQEVENERELLLEKARTLISRTTAYCICSDGFSANPMGKLEYNASYSHQEEGNPEDHYNHLTQQAKVAVDTGRSRLVTHSLWGTKVSVGSRFRCASAIGMVRYPCIQRLFG